ncbi:hypothetical protein MUU72_13460 [Streptomyces sp. RS10V-4]|uniref:hypothetical protein n=1 Tax=Streptomyces rhizoryzae TaxID=2932493 RepID=UPI00200612FC|nr:hypothetical protein [Streptomyces rhizoryzae]MCK7624094.1 hypothetical protein [Streptomyces rhizoryzae]
MRTSPANGAAPRLLPWSGPDGKPCYLLPGDGTGYVSRLADRMEAEQLGSADALIAEAQKILRARCWTPGEIHLLAEDLTASLITVRRVAESRGARLPVPAHDEDEGHGRDDAAGGGAVRAH